MGWGSSNLLTVSPLSLLLPPIFILITGHPIFSSAALLSALVCFLATLSLSPHASPTHSFSISVLSLFLSLQLSQSLTMSLSLITALPLSTLQPCQSSHSFALDAVDSLVRCGLLVMEEVREGATTLGLTKTLIICLGVTRPSYLLFQGNHVVISTYFGEIPSLQAMTLMRQWSLCNQYPHYPLHASLTHVESYDPYSPSKQQFLSCCYSVPELLTIKPFQSNGGRMYPS